MTTYTLTLIAEGRDSASGPLGRVSSALGRMGEIAGGILGAGLIQNLGNQIVEFGRKAISATADMQSLQVGLESLVARELRTSDSTLTMTQALQQAAPAAGNLLNQIRALAIQSPYQLGTVNETFRLAMAFGFASDEAMSFTRAVLTMSAGIGASDEMMGRMAYNLAQIRMQGKVTAVDVRQLAMAGFDLVGALKAIGAQHGLTINSIEDFNKALEEGKLKWEDFAKDFEKYANEQFGGAAERMSMTLQGLKSTFSDFFVLTMPKILGPALEKITSFLQELMTRFIAFSDSGALEAWGQALADSFGWIDTLNSFLESFFRQIDVGKSPLDAFEIAMYSTFGPQVAGQVMNFIKGVQSAYTGFVNWLGSLGGLSLPGMDGTNVLQGMQATIQNLVTFFQEQGPQLKAIADRVFGSLLDALKDIAEKVIPWFVSQMEKVSAWFVENGPLITEYVSLIANNFTEYLLPAIVGFWDVISPLLSGILDLILNLATLIMQVATGDWTGAWQTMQLIVQNVWTAISASFMAFVDWIASWFGGSWAEIVTVWTANWQMFQKIVAQVWEIIKSTVAMKFAEIRAVVAQKFEEVKALAAAALAGMAAAISSGMSIVKSAMMFVINAVIDYIYSRNGEFFQRAQGWLIQMKTGIIANIGIVVNAIETLIEAILAAIVPIVIPIVYSYPGAPHIPRQSGGGGGGDGGSCFLAGTLILMGNDSLKPIEEIQVGDHIRTRDMQTGKAITTEVTNVLVHAPEESSGYYTINGALNVTGNHRLLVRFEESLEWMRVDELEVGDLLVAVFNDVTVKTIDFTPAHLVTYNLHIEDENHNYYAEGIVAHNMEKAARGLFDFVVPPGYNNDNYPIYVSSGEVVNVTNPGSYRRPSMASPSADGGAPINVTVNVASVSKDVDLDFMAEEIARRIRQRS